MFNKIKQNNYKCIIVSDYHKGLITNKFFSEITRFANSKGIPVLCDPKDKSINYANIWLLKPNMNEMKSMINYDSNKDYYDQIIEYKINNKIQNIVLTCGQNGIIWINDNNGIVKFQSKNIKVFDVTGAGDVVISYLAIGLIAHFTLYDSIKLAKLAAELKVKNYRTEPVGIEEMVIPLCKSNNDKLYHRKISKD